MNVADRIQRENRLLKEELSETQKLSVSDMGKIDDLPKFSRPLESLLKIINYFDPDRSKFVTFSVTLPFYVE